MLPKFADIGLNEYAVTVFLVLWMAHFVGDFGLQSYYMAENKQPGKPNWFLILFAHSMIHGFLTYVVTLSIYAAIFIVVTHMMIDYSKGKNLFGFKTDQLFHVLAIALVTFGFYFVAASKSLKAQEMRDYYYNGTLDKYMADEVKKENPHMFEENSKE